MASTETSNMKEIMEENLNRSASEHFHHDKGSKFDVRWSEDQKHFHVADRLGHPEIFPTPFETLMRLERVEAHPCYLDQPFIKIPSAEPNKDVDFSAGEIVYENANSLEWGKFWAYNYIGALASMAFYFPYLYFGVNSTPSSKARDDMKAPYFD